MAKAARNIFFWIPILSKSAACKSGRAVFLSKFRLSGKWSHFVREASSRKIISKYQSAHDGIKWDHPYIFQQMPPVSQMSSVLRHVSCFSVNYAIFMLLILFHPA